ncbi:lactate utilization protein [Tissierella sp. MSJ-40]|uniref:Lactate utilization protein n=1 Tax=Tissierella simiarum TaxID=2841534 RepID=A0ABS6EAV9_9FIRM|nr:lactate utilization protein [Tissierella simiarum]MBU5440072.1 lactate utilization protein [Tissierella simiarum]
MDRMFSEVSENLKKNGFLVKIFNNTVEAKEDLLKEISVDESIAIGGSMTISNMNIYEELKNMGNQVHWHWKAEDKKKELSLARNADIYLSSTNALTLDGKFVNIDGTGNRVSSMFYGHNKVYIIVGKNKLCKNYDEAIKRIKTIAAPKNAERLKINTPCRFTGKCSDCNSPDRMCKAEVIIHKNPGATEINVYLVDEELGY